LQRWRVVQRQQPLQRVAQQRHRDQPPHLNAVALQGCTLQLARL